MNTHKRVAIALLGGLAIAGLAGASASTLGGLRGEDVGSDDAVVAACDETGIDVAYTTGWVAGSYVVTAVTLTDVAEECDGQDASLTLRNGLNASLFSDTETADASGTLVFTVAPGVSANALEGISLVISG